MYEQTHDGDLIDRLRKAPERCLYCAEPAASREHAVPQAIGGRLWAIILCPEHNRLIGTRTDEPFIETAKPLVNFLRIRRQDGSEGVEFKGLTDDGKMQRVTPDGRVPGPDLQVEARNEVNRIVRATGTLERLDSLQAQGAFAPTGVNQIIATVTRPPIVNFTIASDAVSDAAAFKMALHFFAGFVGDVAPAVAHSFLPYVLGDRPVDDLYLRVPPFEHALFGRGWPPRHEVACFPAGDDTYVSVLLFGVYPHMCKLPLRMPTESGVRYRQTLLGDVHPRIDLNVPIPDIDWETRLNSDTSEAFGAEIVARLDEIENFVTRRELLEQCEAAATRAEARAMRGGDFFEWYKGELQLEGFGSEKVAKVVRLGRIARANGKNVWELDVVFD